MRNNLIDGWRGISVLAVVVGHLASYRFGEYFDTSPVHTLLEQRAFLTLVENILFRTVAPAGEIGVNFFFVISGFLITQLLIAEENENSKFNIAAFYVRRFFRIVPAFYTYLFVVFVLRTNGLISVNGDAFVRSAAYLCNMSEFKCSWWLAHTWSLSVEEQFYLVWPVLLTLFRRQRIEVISTILVALIVASLFHASLGSFAFIAIGALLASSQSIKERIENFATPTTISISGIVVIATPLVVTKSWLAAPLQAAQPLFVSLIFLGTLARKGPFVPLVTSNIIQKVGLISYSLYLWQQLATAPLFWGQTDTGASALHRAFGSFLLAFPIAAIGSYYLLERPMITIGHRLSRLLITNQKRKAKLASLTP